MFKSNSGTLYEDKCDYLINSAVVRNRHRDKMLSGRRVLYTIDKTVHGALNAEDFFLLITQYSRYLPW